MTPPRVESQELVVLLTGPFLGMTVRDSSLVTLKEPQDYDPALGAKRGSETGTKQRRG